jgi:hypothetical protein
VRHRLSAPAARWRATAQLVTTSPAGRLRPCGTAPEGTGSVVVTPASSTTGRIEVSQTWRRAE